MDEFPMDDEIFDLGDNDVQGDARLRDAVPAPTPGVWGHLADREMSPGRRRHRRRRPRGTARALRGRPVSAAPERTP